MNTTTIRRIVVPVFSAAFIGAAAVGLAGAANAAAVAPQRGTVAVPQTKAQPAMNASPGYWWHRHHPSLLDATSAAGFIQPGA